MKDTLSSCSAQRAVRAVQHPKTYGTHSMRRTKATMTYRKTGNVRAVQLLLGRSKLDGTVRNLGVEVEDALALSDGVEL